MTSKKNTTLFHIYNFKKGILWTAVLSATLFILTASMGKMGSFLWMNVDLGYSADQFFRYCTYLGDGIMWVPVGIAVLLYEKRLWPLLVSAISISTLLVQVAKNYLFHAMPRPVTAISDHSLIHMVPGVEVHTWYSFPSGHTATAFTIFLLGCLLIRRKPVVFWGLSCATLTGYSRIYLAQHFPVDVAAGMLIGIATVMLSFRIQQRAKLL